mgnify:FL=1|jgi:hypothetical protein
MAVIQGTKQFRGIFSEMWTVAETVNFADAATGSGTFASVDVTVPGVALGDIVMGVSVGVDTVDTVIGGAVTAANVVTLTLLNNTAGAVNLAETTAKFVVGRPNFA